MNEIDHIHRYIEEIVEELEDPLYALDVLDPCVEVRLQLVIYELQSVLETLQDISNTYA